MDNRIAGESHALLRLPAKQLCHCPVHAYNAVLIVQNRNKVGNAIEGTFPFLFGTNQGFLRPLPFGYIIENNGYLPILRLAKTEGVHIVPPVKLFSPVLKASRLACQSNPAIDLEPMLFVLRGKLAHSLTLRIDESRLFLEGWIDLQKAIVDRLFHFRRKSLR